MKIAIVIGTRPQYIKAKPFCDLFIDNSFEVDVIDTNQHYSRNMSEVFISDFDLKIDHNVSIANVSSLGFLSGCIEKLDNIIDKIKPDLVVVMGDTNSTLAAAIVANKKGIKLAHLESGIRCNNRQRPEEVNRVLVDELSDIHFVSRECDMVNVSNPVFVGDVEYAFLNELDRQHKIPDISYGDWFLMTIHRQCNMNEEKMNDIFSLCSKLDKVVRFPIHHRTRGIVKQCSVPENVYIEDPVPYFEMLELLSYCRGIITDSGGVSKIAPFFGKKCIIPSLASEWSEVVDLGYAICELDSTWFDDIKIERNKSLYFCENYKDNILREIRRLL
jgi:UDP-N-acetylglucosamine 2-epimerase